MFFESIFFTNDCPFCINIEKKLGGVETKTDDG